MSNQMTTGRVCNRCKVHKSSECFTIKNKRTGLLRSHCKACRQYQRANRAKAMSMTEKVNASKKVTLKPLAPNGLEVFEIQLTQNEQDNFEIEAVQKGLTIAEYIRVLLFAPRPGTIEKLALLASRFDESKETELFEDADLHREESVHFDEDYFNDLG